MSIRYDKSFNQEIARTVSNFNKKVNRLEKLNRDLIPEKIKVSELKAEFNRRTDLKRRLRELEKFSERGIEKIVQVGDVSMTKYQDLIERSRLSLAKRNLTMEIKKLEKVEANKYGFKSDYLINLIDRRKYLDKPRTSLTKSQHHIQSQIANSEVSPFKKNQQFYDNFFRMLFRSAYMSNLGSRAADLITKLKKLSITQLSDALHQIPAVKDFLDKYFIYTAIVHDANITTPEISTTLDNLDRAIPEIYKFYNIT